MISQNTAAKSGKALYDLLKPIVMDGRSVTRIGFNIVTQKNAELPCVDTLEARRTHHAPTQTPSHPPSALWASCVIRTEGIEFNFVLTLCNWNAGYVSRLADSHVAIANQLQNTNPTHDLQTMLFGNITNNQYNATSNKTTTKQGWPSMR